MNDRESPEHLSPPTLDDAVPPKSTSKDSAAVHFAAGIGLAYFGMTVISVSRGGVKPEACECIGVVIELVVLIAVFHGARWLYRRSHGRRFVERSQLATVAGGIIVTAALSGVAVLVERLGSAPSDATDVLFVVLFLVATAASPWWVYRPVALP